MTPAPELDRVVVDGRGEHLPFVAADGAGADRIVGVELPVGRGTGPPPVRSAGAQAAA